MILRAHYRDSRVEGHSNKPLNISDVYCLVLPNAQIMLQANVFAFLPFYLHIAHVVQSVLYSGLQGGGGNTF